MTETIFQELIKAGLGRAILYARDNDVRPFRDVILAACLQCYSIDPQSEGTRAGFMFELVNLLPDRRFYCDEVLKSLPSSADDWNAVQRFDFATYMALNGDERAKRMAYESYNPGPKNGEAIAIDFVRMDGLSGLIFAAAKIGALLMSKPDEVDQGWLWSQAVQICGEEKAKEALSQASLTDPRVEAYLFAALARPHSHDGRSREVAGLSYEELKPRMANFRSFQLGSWGKQASTDNLARAARGLETLRTSSDQIQHLRIFSRRAFPLDPGVLLTLSSSTEAEVAYAAAVALSNIQHPAIRTEAFRLADHQLVSRMGYKDARSELGTE